MAKGKGFSKRQLIVIGTLVVVIIIFFVVNNKSGGSQPNSSNSSNGQCQVQVTADMLNVRSNPENSATVVGQLQNGKVTPAEKTVQNGFRQLAANQWAESAFLKPVSGAC